MRAKYTLETKTAFHSCHKPHYWIMLLWACNPIVNTLCGQCRVQPVQLELPDRWWWWGRAGGRQLPSSRWRRLSAPTAQQSDPSTRTHREPLLSERRWTPDRNDKGKVVSTPTDTDNMQWSLEAKNRQTSWVLLWKSSCLCVHPFLPAVCWGSVPGPRPPWQECSSGTLCPLGRPATGSRWHGAGLLSWQLSYRRKQTCQQSASTWWTGIANPALETSL